MNFYIIFVVTVLVQGGLALPKDNDQPKMSPGKLELERSIQDSKTPDDEVMRLIYRHKLHDKPLLTSTPEEEDIEVSKNLDTKKPSWGHGHLYADSSEEYEIFNEHSSVPVRFSGVEWSCVERVVSDLVDLVTRSNQIITPIMEAAFGLTQCISLHLLENYYDSSELQEMAINTYRTPLNKN